MTPDTPISDADLLLNFESLGDNCELGLVQRRAGVEPLGLFRFAGAPVRHLIRAMNARFQGIADPDHVHVQPENGEYMIKLTKYDFIYHAYVKIGEAAPDELQKQQVRTVQFLVSKLIADLENPTKVMVFRQNEPLLANDLTDLRLALSAYGPSTLLWVQEARPGCPAGEVTVVDPGLMIGYVRRLARRDNVPNLDGVSWLTMLRNAHALRPAVAAPPARPGCALTFGRDGNATDATGEGWSGAENGYTWSINDRSHLTLPHPGDAACFVLAMDVVPYIAPPAVTRQTLTIEINGETVHTFDPLPRGRVACIVSGRLLQGHDSVNMVLHHPLAASPSAVASQDDARRLAVSFYTVSLTAA